MSHGSEDRDLRYPPLVAERGRDDASMQLAVMDAIRGYAIVGLDVTARIVSWSAGAERLAGFTASEARGQPYLILDAGHRAAELPRMLDEARENGCFQQERWWRRSDGGLVWVHETINPVNGNGYVVIVRDLTACAAADGRAAALVPRHAGTEQELRTQLRSAERRAAFMADASSILVAASPDFDTALTALARLAVSSISDVCVIHMLDRDGTLARVGLAHRDAAVEQRLANALNATLMGSWEDAVRSVIGSGRTEIIAAAAHGDLSSNLSRDAGAASDRALAGSLLVTPLMGRGRVLGAISFIAQRGREYDASDQWLAEELGRRVAIALDNMRLLRDAHEASRAKADFLAVISHELRTPLNAIMGYSDLLDAGISGALTPAQQHQVARVRASATHLLHLIEEILSFARIEAGEADVRSEVAEATELARMAAAVMEPLTLSKGLELRIDAAAEPIAFETDVDKVKQVLVNLLSNAVKFTDRGAVTVKVRSSEAEVSFAVIDTGIGIAEDKMQRIFDPFWQAERPNTRRAGGTGLGLSVTRRYVRLLSGQLAVDSRPGQGTCVTVRLPRRLTSSAA
jgi:PAS domain S-box-containing protein